MLKTASNYIKWTKCMFIILKNSKKHVYNYFFISFMSLSIRRFNDLSFVVSSFILSQA